MEQNNIENLLVAITERLELIDSKINNLDSRMNSMDIKMDRMETQTHDMDAKIDRVEAQTHDTDTKIENLENDFSLQLKGISADVSKVKVTLENETNKKIQFLAEGFQSVPEISEKVDSLSKDMEIVKFDVDIVKKVVTTHSTELNKLGMAK